MLVLAVQTHAQDNMPSTLFPILSSYSEIAPDFQHARNIAILNNTNVNGFCNGFESLKANDSLYIVIAPDSNGYKLFNVNDPSKPTYYGKIIINTYYWTRDVESKIYSNDTSRIFIVEIPKEKTGRYSCRIVSIPLTSTNLNRLNGFERSYTALQNVLSDSLTGVGNIEMLYEFEGKLFVASNDSILHYYDVSLLNSFALEPAITLITPPSYPTRHISSTKIHEVKGYKRINGEFLIGLGIVRAGMCILHFDQNWNYTSSDYQIYEFDRTLFPDTVINPYKDVYDPNNWSGEHQHKWDWRICHSVLPYDNGSNQYVLTVDEYTNFIGFQDINGNWDNSVWEC